VAYGGRPVTRPSPIASGHADDWSHRGADFIAFQFLARLKYDVEYVEAQARTWEDLKTRCGRSSISAGLKAVRSARAHGARPASSPC